MSSEPGRTIGTLHFLIVEDNQFTAIVVNKTLESLGATRIATARTFRIQNMVTAAAARITSRQRRSLARM